SSSRSGGGSPGWRRCTFGAPSRWSARGSHGSSSERRWAGSPACCSISSATARCCARSRSTPTSRSGAARTRAGARRRRWGGCSDERTDEGRRGRRAARDPPRRAPRAAPDPQGGARAAHRRRDRRAARAVPAMTPDLVEPSRGRRRWLLSLIERPSPIAKQLPTLLLLVIGIVIVLAAEGIDFTSLLDALIGIGGVVAATILAIVMTVRRVWDGWIVMLVPMIDIVALGLFRSGTGGAASLFGGFVLLPVVWLA